MLQKTLFKVFALSLFIVALTATAFAQQTYLDKYIAKADPAYQWKLMKTIAGEGCKAYVLRLTSQTWRSAQEVDRPVWTHWLTIVKPDTLAHHSALLVIGGGSNKDQMPSAIPERGKKFALETHSLYADLSDVPNQPLYFADSKDHGRSEDDLIAYSYAKQMETGDDSWLARLPMVKSGVRAMDAIQEFMASPEGGKLQIEQFVVAGGSKRGWTTWLVGAVDKRVVAIMPVVIDVLNSQAAIKHQFEAYGFFSTSLNDYTRNKILPDKLDTPEYRRLLAIEDPYEYLARRRLRMPKFIMNASGDQFFLPDSSQFYWDKVRGEKHLRYVPNAKHNLAGSDAVESMLAFYEAVLNHRARPEFTWKKQKDGALVVFAKDQPKEVNLWQATNPQARDFRVDTIGKAYTSSPVKAQRKGVYVGRVEKPASGYTAFFVELVYDSGGKYPFKFTTEVSIVPDVLPFHFKDAKKSNVALK
ncbi:MAG: PhoPQ-activated pathogenicity-related family protein [Acidobacteria bacterium]|nr:PhoPQ-activated pathogenicity-related family protein [Acidobacteriota bacterium]